MVLNSSCSKDSSENQDANSAKTNSIRIDPILLKVILTIDGIKYTNQDFERYYQIQYSNLNLSSLKENIIIQIFKKFVNRKLILHKINLDKMQVSRTELKSFLKNFEISPESSSLVLENNFKIQKYLSLYVYNNVTVNEKEILGHYSQNRREYRKKAEILLHQIKVNNMEKAIQIRKILLKNPEKFGEIAQKDSTSLDAVNLGRMGYFELGVLPKEIENQVFSLRLKAISPIVETPYGYHIFKITKKRGKRLVPLSLVKDKIKDLLMSAKLQLSYNNFIDKLKNSFNLTSFYKNLYILNKINKNLKGENINENN